MRRILLWVNLLTVLLLLGHAAVAVCQGIPAATPTPPPCVPPFRILKPDTPKKALEFLMAGNVRFVSGKALHPNQCPWGAPQTPFAEILSCADARVPPEILFDTGNNQLFIVREAGNTVGNPHIDPPEFPALRDQNSLMFQSLEYGVTASGLRDSVKLLLVLGHTSCGAVNEAIKACPNNPSAAIVRNICPALSQPPDPVTANVVTQVNLLKNTDPYRERIIDKTLAVVGGVYNVVSGKVTIVTPTP